jgi:hypothetical protein
MWRRQRSVTQFIETVIRQDILQYPLSTGRNFAYTFKSGTRLAGTHQYLDESKSII